jgi:hypothetical protein
METTIYGIIGVIGVYITWLAYKSSISKREDIEHLVVQFRSTQKAARQAQSLIKEYADKHDCWDEIFLQPNITYQGFYDQVEKEMNYSLDDQVLKNIVSVKPSKQIIQSNIESVRKQFETFEHVRINMEIFLRTHQ